MEVPAATGPSTARKKALRAELLAARRRLSAEALTAAADALAERLVATEEVRRAATVACYVGVGTEPGTGPLLERLLAAGRRVLLPVLLPDDDLDWAVHTGPLVAARRGLLEPSSPRLGVEAVAAADVVLVPGLAADRAGVRLGRGGGSYDRALARVAASAYTCVLLHDGELLDAVPAEPHDRRVTAAATPSGVTRFAPAPA